VRYVFAMCSPTYGAAAARLGSLHYALLTICDTARRLVSGEVNGFVYSQLGQTRVYRPRATLSRFDRSNGSRSISNVAKRAPSLPLPLARFLMARDVAARFARVSSLATRATGGSMYLISPKWPTLALICREERYRLRRSSFYIIYTRP